jgi:hypothetical protein
MPPAAIGAAGRAENCAARPLKSRYYGALAVALAGLLGTPAGASAREVVTTLTARGATTGRRTVRRSLTLTG